MDEFTQKINSIINQKLSSMTNMVTGNHAHNGYDVNQIDPAIGLLGFPVLQVADATVSPITSNINDTPSNGTFRFYVDTTPRYRLWAWLNYQNSSGVIVGSWQQFTTSASAGTVTSVSVVSANGFAGTVATSTTTPAITLSTTITGILKGNGTAISAATSGSDYAPPTSGASILYGNTLGGFSNVTVSTGLSFIGGTLTATGTAALNYSVNADETAGNAFTTQINFLTSQNTASNGWLLTSAGANAVYQVLGSNGFSVVNAGLATLVANARMQLIAPSTTNIFTLSADTPNTYRLRFYGRTRSSVGSNSNRVAIGFSDLTGGSTFYSEAATGGRDIKFVFNCYTTGTPTTYAVCSNGASVTTTNLNVDPNIWHIYEIVVIPQTSAKFYIDATLVATITTNLYASGGQSINYEIGSYNDTNPTDIAFYGHSPTFSLTL